MVADLGWVDFDFKVSSSCLAAKPVLSNSHLFQQNLADSVTSEFESTQPMSATNSITLYVKRVALVYYF